MIPRRELVGDAAPVVTAWAPPAIGTRQPSPKLHDGEWLRTMYVDAHAGVSRIATVCGTTTNEVVKALRRHGIRMRGAHQGLYPLLRDEKYMVDALVVRGLSRRGVARELGCSEQAVGDASRRGVVQAALAAAGWGPAVEAQSAQTALVGGLPGDGRLVELVISEGGRNGWATVTQIMGTSPELARRGNQLKKRLDRLVRTGVLERTTRHRSKRGRRPHVYRVARGVGAR